MGGRWQAGKPFWYVTSHPRQLSLAVPQCVDAVRKCESWDVRGTARDAPAPCPWSPRSVNWCLAVG